ncbi:hypothetical protein M5K25_027287 [Dendrobium thyrsiflorum]|uniref:WD repeat-containing protein RUP2 n=1 Tax=Dendrobium thyrsiflorum TaxID=117978 RepID=A0ABD0TZL2_DENTH
MDYERGASPTRIDEPQQGRSRAHCDWNFRLATVVSPPASRLEASDVIGAIELDPSDSLLATAGIARKIRIYTLSTLLPHNPPVFLSHSSACDFYLCTPARLSSLRFRPATGSRLIAAADYDGVVTEYDLENRESVFERDEHNGRRVWSVDFSAAGDLGASGSDDGVARVWDPRSSARGTAVHSGSGSVCCVEFDRVDNGPYLALGCADRRAYVYDLRATAAGPVAVFGGHERTVTYVRFMGGLRMLSSGTDGSHRLWEGSRELRAYRGHRNWRSFVGMAVWREGGLIGCGSETNEVFVYDLRWGEPIWVRGFGRAESGFTSAVYWRGAADGGNDDCTLIAGGSDGVLQFFSCRRNQPAG